MRVVGNTTAQRHEAAHLTVGRAPMLVTPFEDDRSAHAAPQPHRYDKPATGRHLILPSQRHVTGPDSGHHPVIRATGQISERAVAENDVHLAVAGCAKVGSGRVHDVGVNVDRDDRPLPTSEVSEECSVVAGPRADLQNTVTGPDAELVEHHRDNAGLGRGTDRDTLSVILGTNNVVGIRHLERYRSRRLSTSRSRRPTGSGSTPSDGCRGIAHPAAKPTGSG